MVGNSPPDETEDIKEVKQQRDTARADAEQLQIEVSELESAITEMEKEARHVEVYGK